LRSIGGPLWPLSGILVLVQSSDRCCCVCYPHFPASVSDFIYSPLFLLLRFELVASVYASSYGSALQQQQPPRQQQQLLYLRRHFGSPGGGLAAVLRLARKLGGGGAAAAAVLLLARQRCSGSLGGGSCGSAAAAGLWLRRHTGGSLGGGSCRSAAAGLWLLRDDRHGSPAAGRLLGRLPGHVQRRHVDRTKQYNGVSVTHACWRPPGRGRSDLPFSLRNGSEG